MTLEQAIKKATLYFDVIGKEVKHLKKGKIRKVGRITAFKRDTGTWDVAVFFDSKFKGVYTLKPNCYLREFLEKYEVISTNK
jgi:hypothetical protein